MRYSVFAGGKRLRPALCAAGYSVYHEDYTAVLPIASAIEMAHTYSLIHDDLPSMDDDDFRRGIPSCHREFGEAMAILAGDALLTLAFETVAACRNFPPDKLARAAAELAHALGTQGGMIAGQVLDLQAEGRSLEPQTLEAIHGAKTGALLTASVSLGAYLGGAGQEELEMIRAYGRKVGLAFQIVDDLLDESDSKDRERRKATYPGLFGVERSRRLARELSEQARDAVQPLGKQGRLLMEISAFLETRVR